MERACMTPDQFFDHLDKLFGCDDGYIPHLERIRALIEENEKLKAENEKLEAKVLLLQSSEEGLEKKLDTGGWSPTSSPEPKQLGENDPEQYGEATAREGFKNEQEYQEWLKNSGKEGVDY
jgi:regulator of replication initiation timing